MRIAQVRCPVLLFHGELDQTIPVAHGRTLLAAAPEPKEGVFFPQVNHNDFDNRLLAKKLFDFSKKQGLITSTN